MSHPKILAGPLSRRRFLQLSGAAGASAFLVATATGSALGASRSRTSAVSHPNQEVATDGGFRMATWIGYIDIADDLSYPSLDRFTAETGVTIDYQEAVEDNEIFLVLPARPDRGRRLDRLGHRGPHRLDGPAPGHARLAGGHRAVRERKPRGQPGRHVPHPVPGIRATRSLRRTCRA